MTITIKLKDHKKDEIVCSTTNDQQDNQISLPMLKIKYLSDNANKQGYSFFQKIADEFFNKNVERPCLIAPLHIYEEALPMIQFISKIGYTTAVIPKNSTTRRFPEVLNILKENLLNIQDGFTKHFAMDSTNVVNFIKRVIPQGKRFVIMDHGGYFASSANAICREFGEDQFIGFTEFTDNGHKKYENFLNIDRPILSIAHSKTKIFADKEAAESITHAIDHILRENFGMKVNNPNQLRFGIIGYGRIGSNVANYLRKRSVYDIKIADINYISIVDAITSGFKAATIEHICQTCDIIISATGVGALQDYHYKMMKDGVIVATVTSPDDELNINFLLKTLVITPDKKNDSIAQYTVNATGKKLFLICNGESPNTMLRAGTGNYTLFLPQASQMVATIKLSECPKDFAKGIQNLSHYYESKIAQLWFEHFHNFVV